MSNDGHVRKRGADKRRKKVVEETSAEETIPLLIPAADENIHVQKDQHLGGNLCSKVVFFCLFGTLAVLVGLLIIEFQGSGDVESAADSPWSVMLQGWVDEHHDEHEHDNHLTSHDHSEEEEVESEVPFELYGVPEPDEEEVEHNEDNDEETEHASNEEEAEHDDDEDEHDDNEEDELNGKDDDENENDDGVESKENELDENESSFGYYKSLYQSIYSGKDTNTDDDEKLPESQKSSENDMEEEEAAEDKSDDPFGEKNDDAYFGNDSGFEENDELDNESGPADDELEPVDDEPEPVDDEPELAGDDPEPVDDEQELADDEHEPADDELKPIDDTPEPVDEPSEEAENLSEGEDELNNQSDGKNDVDDDTSNGNDFNNDDLTDDDNLIKQILAKTHERKFKIESSKEKDFESEAEEHIKNVMNELRKKKLEEDVSQELFDEEPTETNEIDAFEDKFDEEKEQPDREEVIDDDGNEETVGVILKFGVGVALLVVAHVVLIKKWNSWESVTPAESELLNKQPPEMVETENVIIDRRESLVDFNSKLPTPSESEVEDEEEEDESKIIGESTPEESDFEQPITEKYIAKSQYEYEATPHDSEAESDAEISEGEVDEPEANPGYNWKSSEPLDEEIDGQTGTEEESEAEEEEEEPSEDENPPAPSPPPPPATRRRGGPREVDVDLEQQYYEYSDITNDYDWGIRNELDAAEAAFFNESVEKAKSLFEEILSKHPNSIRAQYGIAKCLDKTAEYLKSNTHLLQAINLYTKTLEMPNITNALYLLVANKTIERMRFKGLYQKLITIQKNLVQKFHNEPIHRNNMAVTFLLMNRLDDAKTVLESVINRWPQDGMAAAHYGFILKIENNLQAGVDFLKAGILSNHSGAQDSRFYFHLGDALHRMGRTDEALQIYKTGVAKGMFRSIYQRSLYNVERLTARPWWTIEETTYSEFFRKLEENWKIIQKEALAVYKKEENFVDESENLKNVGDWKQFELFVRGKKITANCKKVPVTCGIISIFEPASSCSRGQVKFSVMMPGTHVWAHCGPTNCRLRAHLGLVVPQGTFLRVAEDTRSWEAGKVIVFDDSFEHEVWHNGSSPRLVLIVDTWHPELTAMEKKTLPPI